jgi:hypothetical protein
MAVRPLARLLAVLPIGAMFACAPVAEAQPRGKPFTVLQEQIEQVGPPMRVIDADGAQVGAVVGVSTRFGSLEPTVVVEIDGRLVLLAVSQQGLRGEQQSLLYEELNCGGPPLVPDFGSLFPTVATPSSGATNASGPISVYIGDNETPAPRLIRSASDLNFPGSCLAVNAMRSTVRATLTPLAFTPPFQAVR